MWKSEATGISPDQWGGRPIQSAPDCATRKVITWDYARFLKKTVGSFFGDLASCFDRIKRGLSNVVTMKKGIPQSICVSRSKTINNSKCKVKTAHGVSEVTYQQEDHEYYIDGEVQGKGDVMCLC